MTRALSMKLPRKLAVRTLGFLASFMVGRPLQMKNKPQSQKSWVHRKTNYSQQLILLLHNQEAQMKVYNPDEDVSPVIPAKTARYYTPKAVADILRVPLSWVYERTRLGQIPRD